MIRILVADDEELERKAMILILNSAPSNEIIDVLEASNGIEALDISQSQRIDIAFLDIHMPGIDGLRVAEKLSSLPNSPIIVMVTAYDYFSYARQALRYGVIEYLLKPASTAEVYNALFLAFSEIKARKEEEKRQAEAKRVAADLKDFLRAKVYSALRENTMDTEIIRQLVKLETGSETWLCIALVAGIKKFMSGDMFSLASSEFNRIFPILSEKFLISDIGLAESKAMLFVSPSEPRAEAMRGEQILDAIMNVLIILPYEINNGESDESFQEFFSRYRKHFEEESIARFLCRCRDAGARTLRIGISATDYRLASTALRMATTAFNLSSVERPVIVLNPTQTDELKVKDPHTVASLALLWLEDHFMENIGLKDLAMAINISPSHLSRLLMKETGISFGEILSRIRIARAKSLLLNGVSVKVASFLVGFRDQSYFTKVFTKIEGISPSHYIEQFQSRSS